MNGVVQGIRAQRQARRRSPSSEAVAGDLVFRTLTYLLPIPVGAITYVIWRRKKSWLKPRGPEPQSSA